MIAGDVTLFFLTSCCGKTSDAFRFILGLSKRNWDGLAHLDLLLEVDDVCAEVSVIYMTSVVSFGKM